MHLSTILSRLRGAIGANRKESDQDEKRVSLVGEVFPVCPICGRNIRKHRYIGVARVPLTREKQTDYAAMMDAVKNHEWNLLLKFEVWEPLAPDAEVYLIRCPAGRYNLAVIYAAYSLGDVNYVIYQEELQPNDLPEIAVDWQTI